MKRDKIKQPNSAVELPDAKRKKLPVSKDKELLLRRYPIGIDHEVPVEDQDCLDAHRNALSAELAKSRFRVASFIQGHLSRTPFIHPKRGHLC